MPAKCNVNMIVIDILKPHKPDILELARIINKDAKVHNVNITVYAVDEKTESAKITLSGKDINYEKAKKVIEHNGAVIHSIDQVIIGKHEPMPKVKK